MLRRVIAGLFVVGMAIGVWLLWPGDEGPVAPTTTALASEPSTSPPSSAPPTTSLELTTSTTRDDHVVETVEEAEAILRELWFGWFEGIYNQDEDRIREVVATEEQVEAGLRALDTVEFSDPPDRGGILFLQIEILRSDADCLAVWSETDSSFLEPGPPRVGVEVIRWSGSRWRLLSAWTNRGDLWEADCESLLQ